MLKPSYRNSGPEAPVLHDLCSKSASFNPYIYYPIFMSKYRDTDLPTLLELLVKYTTEHTRLFNEKILSGEKFAQVKKELSEVQEAIRKKKLAEERRKTNDADFRSRTALVPPLHERYSKKNSEATGSGQGDLVNTTGH